MNSKSECYFINIGAIGNSEANNSETTDISFINISKDGPTVSFKGSPKVSPTTLAA
jgi:hypothetical protein